ncbi:MAG: YitT family protein [Rectinemataceae bacterium]
MNKKQALRLFGNAFFIQAGAVLASFALERFLVPNRIMDGGVVGIAIIVSYLSILPLGFLVFAFNLPFLVLSLKLIGKRFLFLALYAVASFSVWVSVFEPVGVITSDLFLATIFGGIILGAGVGLIIRNGGCLDGTEIVSIILTSKIPFSVGEIVMGLNVVIFSAAGLVFGIDRALYSVAAYIIAYKAIDLVVEGIDQSKAIFIVSDKSEEISNLLFERLKAGITIFKGMGGYSKADRDIIYVIVRRLEISKIKNAVRGIDDNAFITIHNVHEVIGKNVRKGEK